MFATSTATTNNNTNNDKNDDNMNMYVCVCIYIYIYIHQEMNFNKIAPFGNQWGGTCRNPDFLGFSNHMVLGLVNNST